MNFLGKNIRHLRKQFSQTQSGLAEVMDKGQTTIGNWENGVSEPSLEELLLLSNYFGTAIDILLKVDLSLTNWEADKEDKNKTDPGKKEGYDHEKKEESIVKEQDEVGLSYVLHALQRMQSEIDRINAKIENK